jgi:6-pyruvoyltetrahydropterin/6-carboxytetrahydropterin synthase
MASVIRVTKEFSFEMAHALTNYDGPCRNIHGHSYRLFVTVSGIPSDDPRDPRNGMVIDFSELKEIVGKEITGVFDHALTVNDTYGEGRMEDFKTMFNNVIIVRYQPTCENLIVDFAERIKKRLPGKLALHSLKLYETANSYAEWFASDNK